MVEREIERPQDLQRAGGSVQIALIAEPGRWIWLDRPAPGAVGSLLSQKCGYHLIRQGLSRFVQGENSDVLAKEKVGIIQANGGIVLALDFGDEIEPAKVMWISAGSRHRPQNFTHAPAVPSGQIDGNVPFAGGQQADIVWHPGRCGGIFSRQGHNPCHLARFPRVLSTNAAIVVLLSMKPRHSILDGGLAFGQAACRRGCAHRKRSSYQNQ